MEGIEGLMEKKPVKKVELQWLKQAYSSNKFETEEG